MPNVFERFVQVKEHCACLRCATLSPLGEGALDPREPTRPPPPSRPPELAKVLFLPTPNERSP
eukprot:49727-Pyramimonas_sp.AAC.1